REVKATVELVTRNPRLETVRATKELSMDGKAIVQSVTQEIDQPGVRRLMESRYFSELREGKLSIKRLEGWAIQHYLHNQAILRAFALGMVTNAHDPEMFGYYTYHF